MRPRNLKRIAYFTHGSQVVEAGFCGGTQVECAELVDNDWNVVRGGPLLGLQHFNHDGFFVAGFVVVLDGRLYIRFRTGGHAEVARNGGPLGRVIRERKSLDCRVIRPGTALMRECERFVSVDNVDDVVVSERSALGKFGNGVPLDIAKE